MTIIYEADRRYAHHLATLLGEAVVVESAQALVEQVNTDRDEQLVLFGPGAPLADAVEFAGQCRLRRPELGVILLRPELDVQVLADALKAGVREVVDPSDHAALLAASARSRDLSRQLVQKQARPTGRASVPGGPAPAAADFEEMAEAQVITVFSAKGGCGKSTIATNLAITLAQGTKATGRRRVCLIDLDLAFGDVAIMLQLSPQRTIADAVPVADRIDETGLRTLLTRYEPSAGVSVDVLLAPVQPAQAEEVTRDLITEVIHLARGMYDFVVIDTASAFTEQMLAALDATHHYVLVATPELPSLKNLRVTLDMFDLLDYRREARTVVLNRADSKVGLTMTEIEKVIRVPIAGFVPSSRDVPLSANRGVPLATGQPQHPVSGAIRELAEKRFLGTAPVKRGIFARKKG
ncbi:CpaE family protein [Catellatospora bangladeshensis]|uniref:Pilus assembly protein CpaB n=1 Tax=Catellatospora bangladeshensis TaxID=310355 RepID=A0A8J3JWR6_9ACTN|nr:P-loop NTPase [Catellatospora bangladeshensis]GIF84504.1 pilus assembly protein CpaB [Catellatospora bangladeshensis]